MTDSKIVLKPKSWIKAGFYITAPLFIALSIYLLYSFYSEDLGSGSILIVNLSLIISAIIILVGYGLYLPVFHRFKITIDDEKVQRESLKTTSITYPNIDTVIAGKGVLEIKAEGLLNRISIGNLYLNFEEGRDLLSEKLKDRNDIHFKGSDKYIRYFKEGS